MMGDRENWTNAKFGKLNQQKICISASFLGKVRKGHHASMPMHKCFKCWNQTYDGWWGKLHQWKIQKTESMKNLHVSQFYECWRKQNISISHYKKIEKWLPFHKYWSYRKLSNYRPPKVWISGFLSVDGNRISALAIIKKIEKWPPFHKYWSYGKCSNYQPPPKVWVFSFLSVDRNGISALLLWKKLKNGHHFINIHQMFRLEYKKSTDSGKFEFFLNYTKLPKLTIKA